MNILQLAIGISISVMAIHAHADVYKYVDQAGEIWFADEPLNRPGLTLEWHRTSKRLVSENKRHAEKVQQEQAAIQARIDARLKASLEARTERSKSAITPVVKPGAASNAALRVYGEPLRKAIVEKQGEAAMEVWEYRTMEIYNRGGVIVAIKKYK